MYHNMALDPIDLNFKVVAKPKTRQSTPKVAPGKGLSATSAAALSKLLTFEAKEDRTDACDCHGGQTGRREPT